MDITQAYAIGLGGLLFLLILMNFRQWLLLGWNKVVPLSLKYFVYPQIRHRLTGAWHPAGVIAGLLYSGVNVFCVCFKVRSVWVAGLRAANLSLINMIPLMAGPHLSFPADLLGVTLRTYRRFHRSLGLMSSVLLGFHVLTVLVEKKPFPLQISENLFGLIVCFLKGSCSRSTELTKIRGQYHWASSCLSHTHYFAVRSTSSSFACIRPWLSRRPTAYGAT